MKKTHANKRTYEPGLKPIADMFDFLPDGIEVESLPGAVPEQTLVTELEVPPPAPTVSPAKPKTKIDIRKAVELRLKGVSLEDIGKLFGVSKQAVHQALQPYVDGDDIDLEIWKEKRADILAGKQSTVLSKLTPDDIDKASPRDKAVIFGVLYDKERLERGQSTSNQSVFFRIIEESDRVE